MTRFVDVVAVLAVGTALAGCESKRAESSVPVVPLPSSVTPVAVAPSAAGGTPPAVVAPPSGPALRIDLVANRLRFDRYDRGLVVRFADESFRKYDLAYNSPWRPAPDGAHIEGGEAKLTVPWSGGPARLRLHADAAKPVRISIDGKNAALVTPLATATPGGRDVEYTLPVLSAGEHVVRLLTDKRSRITELELMPATAGATPMCRELPTPAADALPGAARQTILIEVPAQATLRFTPRGTSAHGTITLVRENADGSLAAPVQLWNGAGNSAEQAVDLSAFAHQLVRLSFESDGCALAWARVAIEAQAAAPRPIAPFENVVLVVVDTLRADRLALYGKTRIATPAMTAAAAAQGVVMLRNQSMAPSSPPSHATIQTGQIPRVHGAAGDKGEIKPNTPVLSAIAKAAGFWTGYVGNNDFAMARFRTVGKWNEFHTPTREKEGVDCKAVVKRTLAMVEKAKAAKQRFFISALPVEPHVPYRYHKGITEKYFAGPFDPPFGREVTGEHLDAFKKLSLRPHSMDQLRGLHDGEVEYFDGCFAALQEGLQQAGVADTTAIIVTSDHGEGLGERGGRVGHAYSLNHELVTVPWVIFGKRLPASVVNEVTSNADIAPTVLDLLGLPADGRMQGSSMMPAMQRNGAALPRVVASEYGKALALRATDWHYVVDYDGTGKLFNIVEDREETRDQSAHHPLWLRYLREATGFYLAQRVRWRAATWGALNNFAASNPMLQGTFGYDR